MIALDVGDPAENMAIDQALHESVEPPGRTLVQDQHQPRLPVLRLYRWSQPTLSLGYFQRIADRRHAESTGLVCVRRSTGGGAIVHHHELTYSLVVPIDSSLTGPRPDLYQQTHLAFVNALSEFGVNAVPFRLIGRTVVQDQNQPGRTVVQPRSASKDRFLCFQRRSDQDLIVSGYKVLGSAQRKSRHAVLQHGSLLMQASIWAPQLPGIVDLTSRPISLERLAECFAAALGESLSIDWKQDEISPTERLRAAAIITHRFASDRWLCRR